MSKKWRKWQTFCGFWSVQSGHNVYNMQLRLFWKRVTRLTRTFVELQPIWIIPSELQELRIATKYLPTKFRRISRKTRKFWKYWCQRNFIYMGLNMVEYLSDLHERYLVRKAKFCSFDIFYRFLFVRPFALDQRENNWLMFIHKLRSYSTTEKLRLTSPKRQVLPRNLSHV